MITDVWQVVKDKKILRGPSPSTRGDWKKLAALNVKHVLDLQTGATSLGDGDLLREQQSAEEFGIRVWNLPLGNILPPSKSERRKASLMMYLYAQSGIYVHCKYGKDRTGIICADYLMNFEFMKRDAVIKNMKMMGMHWWYFFWRWSF